MDDRTRTVPFDQDDAAIPPWDDEWDDGEWDDDGRGDDELLYAVPRRRRSRLKLVVAILGVFVVLVGLIGGAFTLWVLRQINPPGDPGQTVTVVIDKGESLGDIASMLQDKGVITNASVFKWYVDWKGAGPFQAGYYSVRVHDSMGNVIKVLSSAPQVTFVNVTFPEGFTLAKMAQRLHEVVPRLSADTFLALATSGNIRSALQPPEVSSLEGVLFPDTYQVASNDDEAAVLKRMVTQMQKVGTSVGIENAPQKLFVSPYQVLIVASMIEREAKVPEDRAKIARVIYNRLAKGMKLEIDATVIYAMGGNVTQLTQADIDATDSPYNTYKVNGLPPTPIAMPGKASIEAALNPADGPWLYYVVIDKDGHHAFATTLAEQNKNIKIAQQNGVR